ncbi:hypothetical protein LJB86_05750, partial [Deltaproteobacteria bacterium OttesenSCG-928-M10]|nr:hypothetical protein [Deltaproteobacteria bacterium OttesenSCG-928-M10]
YNGVASYVLESLRAAAKGLTLDASLALFSQGLTQVPLVLMLVTPLVTMRSLSPSRRGGTLDFFTTLPVSAGQLIGGQFLAAWLSLAFLSLLSLIPFAVLVMAGAGAWPVLWSTAGGLLALSALFAAVGLLASALFLSPVGAGLGTLGLLGLMWILGWAAPYLDPRAAVVWQGLAFAPRINRLVLGLVDLNDLMFFVILTGLALAGARLFLTGRAVSGAD